MTAVRLSSLSFFDFYLFPMLVGIITISDRASEGVYEDLGGPALRKASEGYGWTVHAEAIVPGRGLGKSQVPAACPRGLDGQNSGERGSVRICHFTARRIEVSS